MRKDVQKKMVVGQCVLVGIGLIVFGIPAAILLAIPAGAVIIPFVLSELL